MGRSRGGFQNPDEDLTQKSRRRKHASNGDNADPTITGERKKALYHCNYCHKDITGKIRIKCGVCSDFDLCVECFSVGAEVSPHKCNHPYRVMDSLSFPLISPDWNADDEMLLVEGIEMYGLWNWTEVCEHVGTKSKEQCILHYSSVYLNSPVFPRPDMSHVAGKNKRELLAMVRCQSEERKATASEKEKEEQSFSPTRVKCCGGSDPLIPSRSNREARVSETKKPTCSAAETNGYNSKRGEFDTEFDNNAEQLLAEMEFKANDTEEERELKLRVVRIYSKKLEERRKRKDFILQRNVLGANPAEAGVSPEEKEMCRRYDVFMRFQSKEEHEELLQSMIAEHRLGRRLQELKEARTAGCQSSDEADRYLGRKRKREPEDREKETTMTTAMKSSITATSTAPEPSVSTGNGNHNASVVDADLLSEPEKRMCTDMRVLPTHYLRMQEVLTIEIFSGKVSKKSDAHCLFKLEPGKVDRVYDVLVSKGIAPP